MAMRMRLCCSAPSGEIPHDPLARTPPGPAGMASRFRLAARGGYRARRPPSRGRCHNGCMSTARTFVKFTFFKLDPAWQRRTTAERAEDKREFLAACEDFAADRSLRAYSTVGTRGDTDLLLLAQSPRLEDIHTFHVVLAQSGLAKWATIPYSYLAMTKRSPYSDAEARPEICTSERRYLFVYPFEKRREWYRLPPEERQRIMDGHIEVGRRYPEITINTAYSFGLDDQEFVVSFEGDDPGQFL